MRHQAADFGDQASGGEKERRPRRIGARADENITRLKVRVGGIEHDAYRAFNDAGRNRCTDDLFRIVGAGFGRNTHPS